MCNHAMNRWKFSFIFCFICIVFIDVKYDIRMHVCVMVIGLIVMAKPYVFVYKHKIHQNDNLVLNKYCDETCNNYLIICLFVFFCFSFQIVGYSYRCREWTPPFVPHIPSRFVTIIHCRGYCTKLSRRTAANLFGIAIKKQNKKFKHRPRQFKHNA